MDPFQGLASLILGKLKDSTIALWWKFLFEICFSGVVSYLTICGAALMGGGNPLIAKGAGMLSAAVFMTIVFRKETSRLTKGMFVALPELEAVKELATDTQTIKKPYK
jgi:F0F1-type ATP synthase assembly protein I